MSARHGLWCLGLEAFILAAQPPVVRGQPLGPQVGVGVEYVFLLGTWHSSLHSGPGFTAFGGYRAGPVLARLGGAISFHDVDVVPVLESPVVLTSLTAQRTELFGDIRYIVPWQPMDLSQSVGLRVGRMEVSNLYPSSAWQFELTAAIALPLPAHPELIAAVGRAVFPDDHLPRSRVGKMARIGTSFAFPVLP